MHADNVRDKIFDKHDIYINELLTRLKTTNKDGITQDPFISVEKTYGDVSNVGEKYVTVEQFKEYLIYNALANGFSLWYERSFGKSVVAKCGQRLPRLFVPDKGKQRKQSRYTMDEFLACPWKCYAR
nr:hypothetical protein [Tanacetum cinerariifolium]